MRQDRYRREEERRKRIKRRRRKKIILLAVLVVLLAAVAAEVFVLMNMTTVDRTFSRDLVRGVHAGWDLSDNDLQLDRDGRITDVAFLEAELESVSDYRSKPFDDDQFGEYAKQYISALRSCIKAAKTHDPEEDFDAFWTEFSQPYGQRLEALYRMYMGDYGVEFYREDAEDEINYLLLQGWAISRIEPLEFEQVRADSGRSVFEAKLKNDSGFNLDYLDVQVELYGKSGKLIETSAAYAENIADGDTVRLMLCHVGARVTDYRIATFTCVGSPVVYDEDEAAGSEETSGSGAADSIDGAGSQSGGGAVSAEAEAGGEAGAEGDDQE